MFVYLFIFSRFILLCFFVFFEFLKERDFANKIAFDAIQ